ncbi:MAG: hypothetical protein ACREDF_06170 [Thermoplasmata archaeon]
MTSPQSPPPALYSPAGPRRPDLIIVAVLAVVAVVVIFVMGATMLGGLPGTAFVGFMCIPLLFVILIIVLALFTAGSRRRTIPPPPPIQQPMVPAGQQGPVALDCPNCGGPPTNVDRFGIATCAYCGTRFLVR